VSSGGGGGVRAERWKFLAVPVVSTDRGRRARRTIKVALAPGWIEFDSAAQVAQLRRAVTKDGKKTIEVVYLITSDRSAGPATLVGCAAWPSTSCASTVTLTSPLPTATTPATHSAR
jgi:hypothetical protein